MNREERKSHRRIPPPIIDPHEIQHGQGQEAAPLYAEEPISTEPHDFRNEIPTLEVSLDAQRTPQRSDLARSSLRSHNPRYSYEQSIQSDSGSIWEDPRALQFEVRKKRRELEEVKRRCIQSESELQNERLKSALLEEENENLRREMRRKERDRSGNQNFEGEIDRLKANLAHKVKEIEVITKELQNSKNEREKLKEHIKVSWQEFEAFKKQCEENRIRLQQTLDEVSVNQRFGSQNEVIMQITQQKNKIASELQKAEKKIEEMKKVKEKLEAERVEEMKIKEKEIRRLNDIIEKQEEIIVSVKSEKEELNRKAKNENKETQTLVERPPEVILPPSTEVEELKPEKAVIVYNENTIDAEEIRESIVVENLSPEEMKFEFSSPTENYFERISYNISDTFISINNGNKNKKENNLYQPVSNLFGNSSGPFEEDINPEITRIPSHDVAKSEEPEIQTWFQEEVKEDKPESIIESYSKNLDESTNSDYYFSNGPTDATDFFNHVDQHESYQASSLASNSISQTAKQFSQISFNENIEDIFDPKNNAKSTSIEPTKNLFNNQLENLFDSDPQPSLYPETLFEITPHKNPFEINSQPPPKIFETKPKLPQSTTQVSKKSYNENIESLFNLNPPTSFHQNIENTFEIPKAHKSSQSLTTTKTFLPDPQESAADFFSHLTSNKTPNLAYGGIPSSLFD